VGFLKHGDKVKVTIMFRGREQAHPERGRALLQKLFEDLGGLGVVESAPLQEGRNMSMLLAPSKEARAEGEATVDAAAAADSTAPAGSATPADSPPAAESATPADTTPAADSTAPADTTPPADATPAAEATPPVDTAPPADATPATDSTPAEA
jgi:translation initiation factor IF-3